MYLAWWSSRAGRAAAGAWCRLRVALAAAPTAAQAQDPAQWDLLKQPKVIPEPNQTILLIEGANNDPEHGTATLGQIVAARQDDPATPTDEEVGGRGVAYEAQGWFFGRPQPFAALGPLFESRAPALVVNA